MRAPGAPSGLFVAIAVPAEVSEAISDAARPWREGIPAARWVPAQNRHVTLAFLGATDPRMTLWVRAQLAAVADATPPFRTRPHGFGAFPSSRRARVLWAGLDDTTGALSMLAGAIREALAGRITLESRPFTAHVTLARCEPPVVLPAAFSETRFEAAPFTVDEISLMQSHLGRPAPVYEIVEGFPLSGSMHS